MMTFLSDAFFGLRRTRPVFRRRQRGRMMLLLMIVTSMGLAMLMRGWFYWKEASPFLWQLVEKEEAISLVVLTTNTQDGAPASIFPQEASFRSNQLHEELYSSPSGLDEFAVNSSHHFDTADSDSQTAKTSDTKKPISITIAYTIAVTSCPSSSSVGILDGAAVLKHSIHLNSVRNPSSQSAYDYHMIAFVHPDVLLDSTTTTANNNTPISKTTNTMTPIQNNATNPLNSSNRCVRGLESLGYEIQYRESPVRLEEIRNRDYAAIIQGSGCCGEKEFLKLYGYTLTEYPIVVQLDVDTILLQPLDELFDGMLSTKGKGIKVQYPSHATDTALTDNTSHYTLGSNATPIQAYFTRDYNSNLKFPPHRMLPPEKVPVQGAFLILHPDPNVFQEFLELIRQGDFVPFRGWTTQGWGGVRKGGGGSDRFQGLVSYFYSGIHPESAVELNPCYYNQNAGVPYKAEKTTATKKKNRDQYTKEGLSAKRWCTKTALPMLEQDDGDGGGDSSSSLLCQDCRRTPLSQIVSIHFGGCGKPWHCPFIPIGTSFSQNHNKKQPSQWKARGIQNACVQFHHAWHAIRKDLESFLLVPQDSPVVTSTSNFSLSPSMVDDPSNITTYYFGHCREHTSGPFGYEYLPLQFGQNVSDYYYE